MSLELSITSNPEEFSNYSEAKIKYTNEPPSIEYLTIGNHGLLFESDIRQQDIQCFEVSKYKAFFKTKNADLSFDILSAAFYLLSRYEEYLPHEKDFYGRYAHESSLSFKENFLHLPLVNIWINHLAGILHKKFPAFSSQPAPFIVIPTYDIDIAFSFKYKGWFRNIAGFIKSPSFKRIKVLAGLEKDPFDSYGWLNELHEQNDLQPLYFFLLAKTNGRYDKNILPHKKIIGQLIQHHIKKYKIGIHPSWQSGDKPELLLKEKQELETISAMPVTKSRYHYIRFNLPGGYRRLINSAITDDYSMGYGSINGFRASVASSFYWFDLQKNEATSLRVHPFCFMEANSYYEQKYSPAEAYEELISYYSICKAINGQLIMIWHNNFLGTDPAFVKWKEIYQQLIIKINN